MTTYIELTKGYQAAVDDDIADEINRYIWHALDGHPRLIYAARWLPKSKPRTVIRMHHTVLGLSSDFFKDSNLVVDHIDRDGLNNTRENLRIVSRTINAKNCKHWENASWIRWDDYRGAYKVVGKDSSFIKWCKTIQEAVEVRNAHYQNA